MFQKRKTISLDVVEFTNSSDCLFSDFKPFTFQYIPAQFLKSIPRVHLLIRFYWFAIRVQGTLRQTRSLVRRFRLPQLWHQLSPPALG